MLESVMHIKSQHSYLMLTMLLTACASTPTATQFANSETESTAVSDNVMNIQINLKEPTANAAGEPLICKEFTKTGTRLQKVKSCHTKAEWDAKKRETQDNIKRMYIKLGSDHG